MIFLNGYFKNDDQSFDAAILIFFSFDSLSSTILLKLKIPFLGSDFSSKTK
jgi:hypothetical protein